MLKFSRKIILPVLLILLMLAFTKLWLDPNHYFFIYRWLDIPMHFLGGFLLAYLFVSVMDDSDAKTSVLPFTLAYLFICVLWEGYELVIDIVKYTKPNGWFDTIKDTLNGLSGLYFYLAAYFTFKPHEPL